MTNFMFDLRHTIRSLDGSPGLLGNATLLLALGIGATTAVFSVVNRVLLEPLPYQEPDRLVMLWGEMAARNVTHFPESPPNVHDYDEQAQLFEAIGGVSTFGQTFVRDGAEPRQLTAGIATWNFLSVLGVQPIIGRAFSAEDGAFNATEVPPGTEFPANLFLPPRSALISYVLAAGVRRRCRCRRRDRRFRRQPGRDRRRAAARFQAAHAADGECRSRSGNLGADTGGHRRRAAQQRFPPDGGAPEGRG
jgi:hypothetical protein